MGKYGLPSRKVVKRTFKKAGKKILGKFVPGYNLYSTADDVYWLGSNAYRILKNRQQKEIQRAGKEMYNRQSDRKNNVKTGGNRRYGIDDWY